MGIDKINNQDLPQSTTPPATTTPSVSLSGGGFGVVSSSASRSCAVGSKGEKISPLDNDLRFK